MKFQLGKGKNVKRGLIVLAASGLIVTGVGFTLVQSQGKLKSEKEMLSLARTVLLSKTSLSDAVNVSGVVESAEVSSVTTGLTAKVNEVRVKVGDVVHKGDVIAVLDDTEIQKEIAEKKQQSNEELKTLQSSVDRAKQQADNGRKLKQNEQSLQDSLVNAAKKTVDDAQNQLNTLTPAYESAKANFDTMNSALTAAQAAADEAEASRQSAYNAWIEAGGAPEGEAYDAYKLAEETAATRKAELEAARSLYNYDEYYQALQNAQTPRDQAAAALQQAKEAYDGAIANKNKAMADQDSQIAALDAEVKAAQEKLNKGVSNKPLEELNQRLQETILKAEGDGKITELKINVGSMTKGEVATIQSTEKLIVKVQIPEFDIGRVEVGMPVKVTSEASDEVISGRLERISPTASSGDNAGFAAEISVQNPQKLYIGSKVKAEIIIFSKEDVFTVPRDAVGTDEQGQEYIRVQQPDGSMKNIVVTTGVHNDYSVEITGAELSEGMEVLADAAWSDLNEQSAQQLKTME